MNAMRSRSALLHALLVAGGLALLARAGHT
jgi:hypothetical protein